MSTNGLIPTGLACDACGYNLRAHADDASCPECGTSVAESRRLSTIPRWPAWRDSDPRWRRRMLLETWVLVLIPLMAIIRKYEWASSIVVPTPLNGQGPLTLDETSAMPFEMYEYVTFFVGVVLLFSNERNRRPGRFDWTRRWGVTTSYGVFLLYIPQFAFITALVVAAIAAMFLGMPVRFQPGATQLLIKLSTGYLKYGPYPTPLAIASLPVFSSVAMMLACAPLYNALRSAGRKIPAIVLLAPLLIAGLVQLFLTLRYGLSTADFDRDDNYYPFYFKSHLVLNVFSNPSVQSIVEVAKWSVCFAIAIRLSLAQISYWRHRARRASAV